MCIISKGVFNWPYQDLSEDLLCRSCLDTKYILQARAGCRPWCEEGMILCHLHDTLFSLRAEPLAVVACAWEQATVPLSAWVELVFLLRGHKGEQEIWRASGVLKRALGWNLEVRPACKWVLLGVSVQVSRSPFSRSKIKGLFRNAGKTLPASKCVWLYGYGFIISFYCCKGNTCVYAAG